jgi:PAS domain S-box-containing protein
LSVGLIDSARERKERCLYISRGEFSPDLSGRLKRAGPGSDRGCRDGDLIIQDGKEVYDSDGSFNPAGMIEAVKKAADGAPARGLNSLIVILDASPILAMEPDYEKWAGYESALQKAVLTIPVTLFYFCEITQLSPAQMIGILLHHPKIMYKGNLYDNNYYIPRSEFYGKDDSHCVKKLLDNLMESNGAGHRPEKRACLPESDARILKRRIMEYEKTIGIFRESESYFRNLVNSAPVAIIMTDRGGKCLYVNDCWRQLSGLSLQESIGSGWQKVVHREDVGRMGIWWYGGRKRHNKPGTVCRINALDGKVKWVELKSSPLYDDNGGMIGYTAMFAEIPDGQAYENDSLTKSPLLENAR